MGNWQVPGDFERGIPIGIQTGNVMKLHRGALKYWSRIILMVLEPLNFDTP